MKAKTFKIVCFSVAGVLLALLIALSAAVGAFAGLIDKFVVGYKESSSDGGERAAGKALVEQIQAEGTVLVKNEDENKKAILPLDKSDQKQSKVNIFGWAAEDWVISGSGSGQVKRYGSTDLYGAFDAYEGVEYNTALKDMYHNYRDHREFSINGSHAGSETEGNPSGSGSLHSFNYQFSRLYEPSINDKSNYSDDLLGNALAYSDTAIVVIGRVSGESNDSPKVQYKGSAGNGQDTSRPSASQTDENRTYLEISTEEEELLKYVGKNYKNVIVLINSTNVMELGFMDTIPGLDACLVVATTGTSGALAIPKILYGDVNPSGRLADTYAYDLSTSSTYVDTGSVDTGAGNDTSKINYYANSLRGSGIYPSTTTHTNGNPTVNYEFAAYTDYRESVYVGYKWYETADKMGFWTSDFAKQHWKNPTGGELTGYKDVVQYPFGYGLSYSNFEWNITYVGWPMANAINESTVIEVGVEVTNKGPLPGQDVVELYYEAPYTENGIEKSSVTLGAFAKTTKVLAEGETEYVLLKLDATDMASYDYAGKKITGGGYVLEKGEYTLTLRTDSHTLAGDKIVTTNDSKHNSDTLTYRVASDIHCFADTVENRFTGNDAVDGVAIDGNSDGSVGNDPIVYLSRNNFTGTFPIELGKNRDMTDAVKKYNLYTKEMADEWAQEHSDAEAVTFGNGSDKMIVGEMGEDPDGNETFILNELGMALGLDYDDPQWEDLLNVITYNEMLDIILHGYTETRAIASIGKPKTFDYDGPNQVGSFQGSWPNMTGFSSITLAQTWNEQLAYSMGLTMGAECAKEGIQGLYGPGVNIHRSPFGGRNYEYYSEDALISGVMCAKFVSAAKNRGVFCYLKHICLYETESGRDGMYTWVTEQALREIYLKPFEIAVKEGGSTAIMTSYGRVGAVWTGGSKALLQEVVTGEWGFRGTFLTDYSDHVEFMDADAMIRAGGDLFMRVGGGSFDFEGKNNSSPSDNSNAFNQALRESTKDLVYMWLNAVATNTNYNDGIRNGTIQDTIVVPSTPQLNFRWYIPVLVVVDVLFAAGAGVLIFFGIKKKDKPVAEANTAEAESSEPTSPADDTTNE